MNPIQRAFIAIQENNPNREINGTEYSWTTQSFVQLAQRFDQSLSQESLERFWKDNRNPQIPQPSQIEISLMNKAWGIMFEANPKKLVVENDPDTWEFHIFLGTVMDVSGDYNETKDRDEPFAFRGRGAGENQRILKECWDERNLANRDFKKKPDMVNSPPHYTSGKIEVIDFLEDQKLDLHLGNVVKYVARAGKKGGPEKELEDLEKALWYLKRKINNLKNK